MLLVICKSNVLHVLHIYTYIRYYTEYQIVLLQQHTSRSSLVCMCAKCVSMSDTIMYLAHTHGNQNSLYLLSTQEIVGEICRNDVRNGMFEILSLYHSRHLYVSFYAICNTFSICIYINIYTSSETA